MAVVTKKSGPIANRDAVPSVLNNGGIDGGMLREVVGTVETAVGDSVGSKFIMGTVPSVARISQVLLSCDDIGATTAVDIGCYRTVADGGAVVDADLFASALSLNAGPLNAVDVTHEAAVGFDIADAEKPLWQVLGFAADPGCFFDVVLTLTGAADAAGTVMTKVRFAL